MLKRLFYVLIIPAIISPIFVILSLLSHAIFWGTSDRVHNESLFLFPICLIVLSVIPLMLYCSFAANAGASLDLFSILGLNEKMTAMQLTQRLAGKKPPYTIQRINDDTFIFKD